MVLMVRSSYAPGPGMLAARASSLGSVWRAPMRVDGARVRCDVLVAARAVS